MIVLVVYKFTINFKHITARTAGHWSCSGGLQLFGLVRRGFRGRSMQLHSWRKKVGQFLRISCHSCHVSRTLVSCNSLSIYKVMAMIQDPFMPDQVLGFLLSFYVCRGFPFAFGIVSCIPPCPCFLESVFLWHVFVDRSLSLHMYAEIVAGRQ
jgi:hypothetical protein